MIKIKLTRDHSMNKLRLMSAIDIRRAMQGMQRMALAASAVVAKEARGEARWTGAAVW
jgi:hypothetical protein